MSEKNRILRVTTVPISMNILLKGQLAFMNQHFEIIGATSYDDKHFNEVISREGIEVFQVEMKRTIAPFQDVKSLVKMYRLIKKLRPHIVHTHTPKAGLIGMLAAYFADVPIRLHTVAGMPLVETSGVKRKLLNVIEKLTYSCATKVYPNSNGLQKIILENDFCSSSKLKVIGHGSSNGINTEHFKPTFSIDDRLNFRKNQLISQHDIVFTFVGRLCVEKGIAELVEAFRNLVKQNPSRSLKLLLVGPLEKENGALPEHVITQINTTPEILAVGRHDDIRPYLEISDIFVFPSYREGFPNVVLQAGAMGLPCIVSNINGNNEIITENQNGLIVAVRDKEGLLSAMQNLLIDKEKRQALAQRSRETVLLRYKQEYVWDEILKEYQTQIELI